MNKSVLEIISCKGKVTLQDFGRFNAQHLGFSASGAADEYAFLFANKLIIERENSKNNRQLLCAALELTFGQISLRANKNCTIAIAGADCQASINQQLIKNWQCYTLNAGDIIDFSLPKKGIYSYIAIKNGFALSPNQQPWLDSFSQTHNEMPLAFTGNELKTHSLIYINSAESSINNNLYLNSLLSTENIHTLTTTNSNPELFYSDNSLTLRFIPSLLFSQLEHKQQQRFLSQYYTISTNSNRMGYRLTPDVSIGKTLNTILSKQQRQQHSLSKPVCYGMIQLPHDEQLIILMKERQTMGGYPVLGTVMQTDLFRLSQLRPGQSVSFSLISHQQAQQQLHLFYQRFISN